MDVNIIFPDFALFSKPIKERVNCLRSKRRCLNKKAKLCLLSERYVHPLPLAISTSVAIIQSQEVKNQLLSLLVGDGNLKDVLQLSLVAAGIPYSGSVLCASNYN